MQNTRLVRPEHLNHYGFLFGGSLLKWVDEVAWTAVSLDYPDCLFVTVGMNEVAFRKSVSQGAILVFHSEQIRKGNTSATYLVEVEVGGEQIFSTEVTLVRVDESGSKQTLPK